MPKGKAELKKYFDGKGHIGLSVVVIVYINLLPYPVFQGV